MTEPTIDPTPVASPDSNPTPQRPIWQRPTLVALDLVDAEAENGGQNGQIDAFGNCS